MNEKMKQEAFLNVRDGIDAAQNSTVPFAIVKDENIVVAGDANDTKPNPRDYEITFRTPKEQPDGTITEERSVLQRKNVFIKPRQEMKAVKLIAQLLPYFKKINTDGTVGEFTDDQILELVAEMEDSVFDTMYDLVATVLEIDSSVKDYMEPGSVIVAVNQIIRSNPSTVNEADTFFG